MHDLERIKKAGRSRVDVTVGSALDIFGGDLPYKDVVLWHKKQSIWLANCEETWGMAWSILSAHIGQPSTEAKLSEHSIGNNSVGQWCNWKMRNMICSCLGIKISFVDNLHKLSTIGVDSWLRYCC